MPEGVDYGPQFTASVGKSLNIIGKHAYGYSGLVAVNNSENTFFEFTSGNYYTLADLQILNFSNSGDDMQYKVYLNETLVASWLPSSPTNLSEPPQPLRFLITPYTEVKITGENVSSSAGRSNSANIRGRIYK